MASSDDKINKIYDDLNFTKDTAIDVYNKILESNVKLVVLKEKTSRLIEDSRYLEKTTRITNENKLPKVIRCCYACCIFNCWLIQIVINKIRHQSSLLSIYTVLHKWIYSILCTCKEIISTINYNPFIPKDRTFVE